MQLSACINAQTFRSHGARGSLKRAERKLGSDLDLRAVLISCQASLSVAGGLLSERGGCAPKKSERPRGPYAANDLNFTSNMKRANVEESTEHVPEPEPRCFTFSMHVSVRQGVHGRIKIDGREDHQDCAKRGIRAVDVGFVAVRKALIMADACHDISWPHSISRFLPTALSVVSEKHPIWERTFSIAAPNPTRTTQLVQVVHRGLMCLLQAKAYSVEYPCKMRNGPYQNEQSLQRQSTSCELPAF